MTTPALPSLDARPPLDSDAISRFRRDGHLLLRDVVGDQDLAPFRSAITRSVVDFSTAQRPLDERDTYGKAFLQVENLWCGNAVVSAYTHARRFGRIAAQLLGVDNVRIYHDQALYKEPLGGYTPWHQDAMYWPLDGSQCITMWMPLIDVTPEMGGLTFASGSHAAGPLSDVHISDASEAHFESVLADGRYPLAPPVPMAAGDATFHAGWTVHKASANETDVLREVMTIIFFADGLLVQEPTNEMQAIDMGRWLPGLQPGDLAASALNAVID